MSELIGLVEAGLQVEEDDDMFFTQVAATVDEAEAAYYRRQIDLGNVGEPSHMSQTKDTFLTQATAAADEAEAAYYRR